LRRAIRWSDIAPLYQGRRWARGVAADAPGQGLVEYGLILALSAVVAIVVLVFFGGTVSDVLQFIANAIDQAGTR
jgi:Flp pilus assembly pilin Flp